MELMVVIAVIGILAAIVFRLMSATGEKNKMAKTIARLERVQNALSAYYAEFGSYPPVDYFECPDPKKEWTGDDLSGANSVAFSKDTATRAAHSQSIGFEYPLDKGWDNEIDLIFNGQIRSAGVVLGNTDLRSSDDDGKWKKSQLFKFGLLSYLLPKAHIAWGEDENTERYEGLFESRLWTKIDPDKSGGVEKLLSMQMAAERQTVARWLPNFEKMVCYAPEEAIMGVELRCEDAWVNPTGVNNDIQNFLRPRNRGSTQFIVGFMTITDGWNNELFYYSPPPYQSYRIWSSGPDGYTFPPWIPMDSDAEFRQAGAWTADDIVRFDR